ncbi:hypothetical protein ACN47E_003677 [Coniothyrium glycines]
MLAQGTRNAFVSVSKRPFVCQACRRAGRTDVWNRLTIPTIAPHRSLQTDTTRTTHDDAPFRKALKDSAKQKKKDKKLLGQNLKGAAASSDPRLERWELTVGIEIHAELNTARKLFSSAATSVSAAPNSHVALFDTAFPGSQPHFQKETLIPAIRAALAFDCTINHRSSFDRKHYFYQDQPAGYQITQYYEPFAKDGKLILYPHDFPPGAAPQQDLIEIGIKQIQMEQDTAKTVQQPPSTHLLDFNRVSHPLIEIITLPHIHDPTVAAVAVRKIQSILKSVNACTAGMEMGGLRADINVSVRERNTGPAEHGHSYHGVTGLGQRTEIKNLASVRAVEDAIIAERDRQIDILEDGGVIEGETRGWTLGIKTTKRLRGKEGEIDYRYMPDPDIPPVLLGQHLVDHLRNTLPVLPDMDLTRLVTRYGLTSKDALTLLSLDDGDRLDYYFSVVESLKKQTEARSSDENQSALGKIAGNWVLMELGSLFKDEPWDVDRVSPDKLAAIILQISRKCITTRSGKQILTILFDGDQRSVQAIVDEESLGLKPLSRDQYLELAQTLIAEKPDMVRDIVEKKQVKKVMWFVGQMLARNPDGSVEPDKAEAIMKEVLGINESGPG